MVLILDRRNNGLDWVPYIKTKNVTVIGYPLMVQKKIKEHEP